MFFNGLGHPETQMSFIIISVGSWCHRHSKNYLKGSHEDDGGNLCWGIDLWQTSSYCCQSCDSVFLLLLFLQVRPSIWRETLATCVRRSSQPGPQPSICAGRASRTSCPHGAACCSPQSEFPTMPKRSWCDALARQLPGLVTGEKVKKVGLKCLIKRHTGHTLLCDWNVMLYSIFIGSNKRRIAQIA